jgi:hypothetical protein
MVTIRYRLSKLKVNELHISFVEGEEEQQAADIDQRPDGERAGDGREVGSRTGVRSAAAVTRSGKRWHPRSKSSCPTAASISVFSPESQLRTGPSPVNDSSNVRER